MMNWRNCPPDDQTGMTLDPRYYRSGLKIDEYTLQAGSGIMRLLEYQSDSRRFVDISAKKRTFYESWSRPTVTWSLECEERGLTREEGFKAFQTTLPNYDNIDGLRKVGIAMVVLYCLGFCTSFCAA